jgi:hypothetical protein
MPCAVDFTLKPTIFLPLNEFLENPVSIGSDQKSLPSC